MRIIRILLTTAIIYTLSGYFVLASSLTPAVKEIKLLQGERTYSSVEYYNKESRTLQLKATPFVYDPKTDLISDDISNIFLKADTDSFSVGADSTLEINYEIIPPSHFEIGTYFNILVLTPIIDSTDVTINKGISQLVVLHILSDVHGISTESYKVDIEIIKKGIPFITPLEIKYIFENNSNYVLTPEGRIDILNKRGNYKPHYIYINSEQERVYPRDKFERTVSVNSWNISDIFSQRAAIGTFYNGLDSNPKYVETPINSYILELFFLLTLIVLTILLVKSIKEKRK
jgi:hypothetical protein